MSDLYVPLRDIGLDPVIQSRSSYHALTRARTAHRDKNTRNPIEN